MDLCFCWEKMLQIRDQLGAAENSQYVRSYSIYVNYRKSISFKLNLVKKIKLGKGLSKRKFKRLVLVQSIF